MDPLVQTVKDIDVTTVQFYESALGMIRETFGEGRVALKFGNKEINALNCHLTVGEAYEHVQFSSCR